MTEKFISHIFGFKPPKKIASIVSYNLKEKSRKRKSKNELEALFLKSDTGEKINLAFDMKNKRGLIKVHD